MPRLPPVAVALAVFGTAACSASSEPADSLRAENHRPSIESVALFPTNPTVVTPVTVRVVAHDNDVDPITFRYRWSVNNYPLEGYRGATLPAGVLKRGDVASVEVTPFDGLVDGTPVRSHPVSVGNAFPAVTSVTVLPEVLHAEEEVRAEATGSDPDGDDVHYTVRWFRNNTEIPDEHDELLKARFGRGDVLVAAVTPYDRFGSGTARLSAPITVHNSAPRIVSVPPSQLEQDQYAYDVQAADRDGDPLRYALEAAPPGMKIDPSTGRIVWALTRKSIGVARVRVVVKDPLGAEAYQEFEMTLSPLPESHRLQWSKRLRVTSRLVSEKDPLIE